eukprot:110215-Hanusia_phi.AAC.1
MLQGRSVGLKGGRENSGSRCWEMFDVAKGMKLRFPSNAVALPPRMACFSRVQRQPVQQEKHRPSCRETPSRQDKAASTRTPRTALLPAHILGHKDRVSLHSQQQLRSLVLHHD